MTDVADRLPEALDALAREAQHDPDLVARVRARAGRRWPGPRVVGALAAALVLVVAATATVLLRPGRPDVVPVAVDGTDGYECPARVPVGELPGWARGGFSDPRAPFVRGEEGLLVAVVFADPLLAPPAPDRGNKVLWVPREGAGEPLRIEATRSPGDDPVVLDVAAGPSTVDLPTPGCWRLEVSWGGRTDVVHLPYEASRRGR